MKYLLIFGFVLYSGAVGRDVSVLPVVNNYHEAVGIPAAERIIKAEAEIQEKQIQQRIVGGFESQAHAHPHLAGLVISLVNIAGVSVCGSSLLSADRLVTAAHCWFDGRHQAWQFTVVLGSQFLFTGGTRIATSDIFVHPQWTPELIANDVAMIFLPQSVSFTSQIQPISLPEGNELFDSFIGLWATAVGYGVTSDQQQSVSPSTVVSEVHVQVISVPLCQGTFGHFVRESNICTSGHGGVGICGGDSGGPLFINRAGRRLLVGISSFVAGVGCELGHPSAFARVSSFHDFINTFL